MRLLAKGLLVTIALACACAFSATPFKPVFGDPLLESWRWKTFPQLSGLGAQCIGEGPGGSVWFGVVDGVWRFDGIDWTHFPNSSVGGGVACASLASDGSFYVGGNWGLSCFKEGKWTRVYTSAVVKLASGKDGSIWAATPKGVLRIHQSQKIHYYIPVDVAAKSESAKRAAPIEVALPGEVINKPRPAQTSERRFDLKDVVVDSTGRVWFGAANGEILCFDPLSGDNQKSSLQDGKWSIFNETDGLVCGRNPLLLALKDGRLWVLAGTPAGDVNMLSGSEWRTFRLSDAGLPADCSNPIQTSDGVIWFSGRYVIYAYNGSVWRTYSRPEVQIPTARNFLLSHSDGSLWIGGPNTEIHRIEYQTGRWTTLEDLNFGWEGPEGQQWFLHRDGRIVCHDQGKWTAYGEADGLIDTPVALLGTRSGVLWVIGSHRGVAATTRLEGQQWIREIHPECSWGFDWRSPLEAKDGSVWLSAAVDSSGPASHRYGILEYAQGTWRHHHQPGRAFTGEAEKPEHLLPRTQRPEPIGKFYCMGESDDGRIWAGRSLLVYREASRWKIFIPPAELKTGTIEAMLAASTGELWLGTRQFGALRYKMGRWTAFQGRGKLEANSIRAFAETADGTIWAATDRGFCRYDGSSWTAEVLPSQLTLPYEGGMIRAAQAPGTVWVNRFAPDWGRRAWSKAGKLDPASCEFFTVYHKSGNVPPRTQIAPSPKSISQLGNLAVLWRGLPHWGNSPAELQYSYRLDGGEWSVFSAEMGQAFFSLPVGAHRLEVRTRDRDFNVDPTPAVLEFSVMPPVWRQTWFIALIGLLGSALIALACRAFLEHRKVASANRELRKLTQAVEQSPASIIITDLKGDIAYVNPKFCRVSGYSKEEVLGCNPRILKSGETKPEQYQKLWAEVTAGREWRGEFHNRRKNGELYWESASISPMRDSTGRITHFLAVKEDITENKAAQERIREQAELLDQTQDAVIVLGLDQRIRYFNRSSLRVFGQSPEGLRMLSLGALLFEGRADQLLLVVNTVLQNGSWLGELQYGTTAGGKRTALSRWALVRDDAGHPVSILIVCTDVTEQKRLEDQFLRTQRLESIGTLASGVAHDLNNILTPILMASGLLNEQALPAEDRDLVILLSQNARRGADLVRQLLTLSRGSEGVRSLLQPRILIMEMMGVTKATFPKTIMLEHHVPEELWLISANATQVHQVLLNLCVNARDAMPHGGTMTISAKNEELDTKAVASIPEARPGQYVTLEVTDTGTGIPPDIRDRIFSPFFTTKAVGKGTGLGLSMVLNIIRQHGGFVRVDSHVGEGSRFSVSFPAAVDTAMKSAADRDEPLPAGNGELVLIVDDELSIQNISLRALEANGYRVLAAGNGVEAMNTYTQSTERIAAVVTDMAMPIMDGAELIRELRQCSKTLRIVAASGVDERNAMASHDRIDADAFLMKPFSARQLVRTLHEVLSKPS